MKGAAHFLERFDATFSPADIVSESDDGLERARSEGYAAGFAAGRAAANADKDVEEPIFIAAAEALYAATASAPPMPSVTGSATSAGSEMVAGSTLVR